MKRDMTLDARVLRLVVMLRVFEIIGFWPLRWPKLYLANAVKRPERLLFTSSEKVWTK